MDNLNAENLVTASIPFALAPALVNNTIMDYSTSEGSKLYKAAITKLSSETQYGCDPTNLKVFLALLKARAQTTGWAAILEIPADAGKDPNAHLLNIVDHYGERTLEQVRNTVKVYVNTKSRAAQDSAQLYHCLLNSLSTEGLSKMLICDSDYTVDGTPSGALFLKVLIRESHIDTNATTRHIREKLGSLYEHLASVGYDIVKMNDYTKGLLLSLKARGETTEDLIANLFKAYKSVPDKNFARYIQAKEDEYDKGGIKDPEQLMMRASNKYRTLVEDKVWNAPTEEDNKILALQARIDRMTTATPPRGQGQQKTLKTGQQPRPEWMTTAPAAGKELESKSMSGKVWWWCTALKWYCIHKPEDCRSNNGANQGNQKTGNSKGSRKERMLRAAQALIEGADTDSEDEEE